MALESADAGKGSPNDLERYCATRLRALWPGATVAGLESLRGDASSRAYSRCRVHRGTSDAPATLVVMRLSDVAVALSSEELGVFGAGGPAELPFFNVWRFLSAFTDAVPRIYDVSADQRVLLLEDVGDLTLWSAARGDADPLRLFRQALRWTAEMQARAADDGRCYAFRQAFDERLFGWEFAHFVEYGLVRTPPALLADVRAELAVAARELASLPRVFCHRDYHAWNIHVQSGDRIRVFDFQDALLGPRLYDVASLLTDRTTPELIDPAAEQQLLCFFADLLPRSAWLDVASLLAEYRLVALQRVLKVVGRFNYLAEVKNKRSYLAMLPAVAATARRLLDDLASSLPATRAALLAHGKVDGGAGRSS
jgi:aminoglycoside/choline kinase family phosphotransferase